MAKENKKEISFVEGPIFQSLIRFALPVLGALILQAAYGAVDLLVVGWFGDASSISAVGTGSNFMQMVTFIITSLAMGSTVMIGQHIGEGKPDKAGKTVGTSIAENGRCGSSACDGSGADDFCHRLHGCAEKRQSAD